MRYKVKEYDGKSMRLAEGYLILKVDSDNSAVETELFKGTIEDTNKRVLDLIEKEVKEQGEDVVYMVFKGYRKNYDEYPVGWIDYGNGHADYWIKPLFEMPLITRRNVTNEGK